MMQFVKLATYACLAVSCLVVGSGAQQPPPPAVPQPPPRAFTDDQTGVGRTFYYPTPDGHASQTFFLQRDDPSAFLVSQLAKQLVDAKTDDVKEKLKVKLKETLVKQFDDRQKRHEKEIEALEAQVKKLKEMVSKRQENKKEIIEDRTKQLEREAKGLGW